MKQGMVQGPRLPHREAMQAAINRAAYCHVWHIGIAQLPKCADCQLGRRVNRIGTWYRIEKKDQCALFEAARKLVQTMWDDPDPNLRGWLQDGFPTSGSIPPQKASVGSKFQKLKGGEPNVATRGGAEICKITKEAASGQWYWCERSAWEEGGRPFTRQSRGK